MSYTYWKWDKAIPQEYCKAILKNIDWEKAETGKIKQKTTKAQLAKKRKTDIVWEDPLSVIGCIADKYIRSANIFAGWNFDLTQIENIQIGKYYHGGFYNWHIDCPAQDENPRKLSFSMLLNDPFEFEGGKLEFKNLKEQPKMEQGSIIVFPSFCTHRVTPVTAGERYSAVTWMRGANFK